MKIINKEEQALIVIALEYYIREEETRLGIITEGLKRIGYKNPVLSSPELNKALQLYERMVLLEKWEQ